MNDKSGTGRMGVVVKRDWKRLCCMTLLAAMALPGRAFAESGDGFRIDGSGQVVLDSDHAAKEGVSSLCFSLTVEAGAGDTVTPMWISIVTTIFIRVPVAYGIAFLTRSAAFPGGRQECIFISLLSSWVAGALITFFFYKRGKWKEKAV